MGHGYAEDELTHAIYSAPFDGKDNRVRRERTDDEKAMAAHPELAEKLGRSWMRDKTRNQFHRAATLYAASHVAPGTHLSAHFRAQAAEELGVSVYRFLFIGLLLIIAGTALNLPSDYMRWAIIGVGLIFHTLMIRALYQKWRLSRRHID